MGSARFRSSPTHISPMLLLGSCASQLGIRQAPFNPNHILPMFLLGSCGSQLGIRQVQFYPKPHIPSTFARILRIPNWDPPGSSLPKLSFPEDLLNILGIPTWDPPSSILPKTTNFRYFCSDPADPKLGSARLQCAQTFFLSGGFVEYI